MSYSIIDRAAIGPKHARKQRRFGRVAAVAATVALSGGAAFATMLGFTSTTPAGTPWVGTQAQTVMSAQLASVNWAQRTCSAFTAYESHPSSAHLRTLITDSLNVPWHAAGSRYGLGSDVYGLGGDVLAGKTTYVPKEEGYIAKDCA